MNLYVATSPLQKAGAISKVTMRQFDAVCPPPVREFSAADIKRLRERLKFSQPVFAHLLHTTASTVRKWEQGDTRPAGPALKPLSADSRSAAAEALRGLVDAILLVPDGETRRIELKGNLAAMLSAAASAKRSPDAGDLQLQIAVVAGARNHLNLEFSWTAA